MTKEKASEWFPLALILLLGGVLLFYNLDLYDIWGDEALTFPKGENFGEVIKYTQLAGGTVHPPIYSLLQFGWIKTFAGWDLGANRLLWAIFGFLSLIIVYQLSKEWFNPKVALVATLLCALSPFLVQYSRMIRYYSLTMFLVLLCFWAFTRLKRTGKWSDWIFFTISSALLLYEDYLGGFVLFFLYFYLLVTFNKHRAQLFKWILAAVVIAILFLPQLPVLLTQAGGGLEPYPEHLDRVMQEAPRVVQKGVGIRGIIVNSILKTGFLGYVFCLGETTYPWRFWITFPVSMAFIILFVIAFIASLKRDFKKASFVMLPFLCILFTTVIGSEAYGIFGSRMFQFPSKVMFLAPLYLILVAGAWWRIKSRVVQVLLMVVILAGNVYGLNNYFSGSQFLNPKFLVPWRQIQADIENTANPQDLILTDEEAFAHNLKVTNSPIESFGLVGAAEKVQQTLNDRGPLQVYLIIRYRGDQTIVIEGLNVRDDLEKRYPLIDVRKYLPVDPEAVPHWKRFLRREPNPYQVEVYRFKVDYPAETSVNT